MRSGNLRQPITVIRLTEGSQNSSGEPTVTWALVREMWAEILPLSGREMQIYQQTKADARYSIRVRIDPDTAYRRKDGVVRGWDWDGSSDPEMDIMDIQDPTGKGFEQLLIAREYAA